MYKILNIGNKDYKLEYTIEASLYKDGVVSITSFLAEMGEKKSNLKEVLATLADFPERTLTLFYAGLLEYHGAEGDGTVTSLSDAKKLLKQYMKEHAEDEEGNMFGMFNIILEQMGEDGFFKQVGLSQMIDNLSKTIDNSNMVKITQKKKA